MYFPILAGKCCSLRSCWASSRDPIGVKSPKPRFLFCGTLFGLLFAHGAIAGACTHIGFVLTAISCLGFSYLWHKSKLLPGEIPILRFFYFRPGHVSPDYGQSTGWSFTPS